MAMTVEEMEKKLKATEAALKELEKRVRVTEDIQAIHQLQRRYVNALICTEWDDCADCFAKDALVDVYLHDPIKGNAAIRKWFKEDLSKTHAGKEGDVLVHPVIEVDGDKAKGTWLIYLMYCYPRTGQSLFWVQGFYRMEYVRENGDWKISYMNWEERMGLPGTGPPTGLW
jgi:ketosteroid isomerase-like protein